MWTEQQQTSEYPYVNDLTRVTLVEWVSTDAIVPQRNPERAKKNATTHQRELVNRTPRDSPANVFCVDPVSGAKTIQLYVQVVSPQNVGGSCKWVSIRGATRGITITPA